MEYIASKLEVIAAMRLSEKEMCDAKVVADEEPADGDSPCALWRRRRFPMPGLAVQVVPSNFRLGDMNPMAAAHAALEILSCLGDFRDMYEAI